MNKPKILLFDIETAPNIVPVWGLWDQNIAPSQIIAPGYVLSFSASWLGDKETIFAKYPDGNMRMLKKMHTLLCEADAVVHYNGRKFDVPTLNREFILAGMAPPSPYVQIDLLSATRACFKFASNKLDYVCQQLGIGKKLRHPGQEMWTACMDKRHLSHAKAWRIMERYNKHDVVLLRGLYTKLRPWFHTIHGFKRISEQLDGKRRWS